MADIASLFGLTPEGLSQQRYQQDLKQGYELAQLDPGTAARATLQSGVGQLGRGIAGMMGVEDPQMKLISARQQIINQVDQTNPESMLKGAQTLANMGDQQGAFALADYARKAQSEIAQAQQRLAAASRERQQAVPADIQIANEISTLEDALTRIEDLPADPERTRAKNLLNSRLTELRRLTAKGDKAESKTDIQKLQEYAATLSKDSPQYAEVQAIIKSKGEPKGTNITNVLPGDKALADIPAFRASIQRTVEPQSKAVFAADNALTNIQDSINTGNFASYRAAQTQFARAISGAGDLSQKELKAAGADPALIGGTADYLATLFTSTPTLDTQEKMKKTLIAIKKVSTDKALAEIEAQRKMAYGNPMYDKARVDQALNFPEFSGQQTPAISGDLAAQAAKILADRQKAKK